MDNPLKVIREGILQHNLQKVCNGFELLTGEKIDIVESFDTVFELIQQMEELISKHKLNKSLPKTSDHYVPSKKKESIRLNSVPGSSQPSPTPPATKKGYYGNSTNTITDNNVSPEEINKNIEKAAITKERKTKRSPPKKYNVKCSQCDGLFESDRQESKDFGQKCPKCLRDTIEGKIIE